MAHNAPSPTTLDRETTRLDALVVEKKRLLDLLAESAGHSSPAPSPVVSTQTSRSATPVSLGLVKFRRIGLEVTSSVCWLVWTTVFRCQLKPWANVAVLRMGDIKDGEIDYSRIGFVDELMGRSSFNPATSSLTV